MELEPGRQIGRYVVEERVGEGGMAVVYRVRHVELDAPFALKVLTLTHTRTLERFLAEGRVQAMLEHPNIVRVIDVLEVDNHPALLMELVEGPTLHDRLHEGRLALAEAEALFRGIVAGVAHAHARGFVHRDLKPANVLLAPSEAGPVPKIADFGIVKLTGEQQSGSTRTGMTMGTPQYMAPEQVRDAKSVDHRADVFSLGCILYELVVGHPPFQGDDVLTVLMASARGRYERPDQAVPELPARFVQAIDGCLRVDREARLPDCEALLAVLDGRVKMPSPPSAEPTARRRRLAWRGRPQLPRPRGRSPRRRSWPRRAPACSRSPPPRGCWSWSGSVSGPPAAIPSPPPDPSSCPWSRPSRRPRRSPRWPSRRRTPRARAPTAS
jgi:serine/threonine protein kinase